MKQKIVYNVSYFEDDTFIDGTQIDEADEELIWDLYKEFEYVRTSKSGFEIEKIKNVIYCALQP